MLTRAELDAVWHRRHRRALIERDRLISMGMERQAADKLMARAREYSVYQARCVGATYREIGDGLGISPERVRQMVARAEWRWQSRVKSLAAEISERPLWGWTVHERKAFAKFVSRLSPIPDAATIRRAMS